MSLTNEMLKDLDKHHKPKRFKTVIDGLQPATQRSLSFKLIVYCLIPVLALVGMIAFLYHPQTIHFPKIPVAKTPLLQKNTITNTAPLPPSLAAPLPITKADNGNLIANSNAPLPSGTNTIEPPLLETSIQAINIAGDYQKTQVQIILTNPGLYQLNTDQNKLTLTLTHVLTSNVCTIPIKASTPGNQNNCTMPLISNDASSLVQDISVTPNKTLNNLQLSLLLKPNTLIQNFYFDNNSVPKKFVLDLLNTAVGAKPNQDDQLPPPTDTLSDDQDTYQNNNQFNALIKRPVKEPIEDKVDKIYQSALDLIAKQQNSAAINKLQSIIQIFPEFNDARLTLATIYLQQNNSNMAIKVLIDGLSLQPKNIPITMLYARALITKGQYDHAFQVLNNIAESANNNKAYLELLTTIYQHQGKYQEVISIYKQLLNQEPFNGRWLVGLGIALEQTGQNNLALQTYEKANNSGNLPFELQGYVADRLRKLGGLS